MFANGFRHFRTITVFAAVLLSAACAPRHVHRIQVENIPDAGHPDKAGFITTAGKRLTWGAVGHIEFKFDPDFPKPYRADCERAATTWNNVLGSLFFAFSGQPGHYSANPDGQDVISWGKAPPVGGAEQANTELVFRGNQIIEADIDFGTRRFPYSDSGEPGAVDVESVCLHELGHVLGLAHSQDPQSVMFPVLQVGQEKREPTAEDMAHVRTGYNFRLAKDMHR